MFKPRIWANKAIAIVVPRGRFAKGVAVLAGGAALGQAITVLVSPILTRLYSPEDFGVFGVYASILGIVTVIASLRYEYALPFPEDGETAANILALCFLKALRLQVIGKVGSGYKCFPLSSSWADLYDASGRSSVGCWSHPSDV